jgi:hypothetical protein
MGKPSALLGKLTADRFWPLLAIAVTMTAVWIGFRLLPPPQESWLPAFALYLTLCLLLSGAWRVAATPDEWTRRQLWLVGVAALGFRLVLLPARPLFSDDIYRYAWEGRVTRAGINPSFTPPDSPDLKALRNGVYPLVNHPDIPAIYPPATQWAFRLGTYYSDWLQRSLPEVQAEVLAQKSVFVLFDLLTLLLVLKLLTLRGRGFHEILLYAWNPLVILEFAGSGHNDSLAICFLWAAYLAWEFRAGWAAGLGLALSCLSKFFSILLLPFLLIRRAWRSTALFLLIVGFVLREFSLRPLFGYWSRWEFNGSLYEVLRWLSQNPATPRFALPIVVLSAAVAAGFRWKDPLRVGYCVTLAGLLFAATVYPWYLVWAIPYLCFFRGPAMRIWNVTIFLSYAVLEQFARTGSWVIPVPLRFLEYLPVFGALAWEGVRYFNESRRHHPGA